MANKELSLVIKDILCGGEYFISGLHNPSASPTSLLTAVVQWSDLLNRDLAEILAVIEPCIRQSILMSLIPGLAVDPTYTGSIDMALNDHLNNLGINVDDDGKKVLRDICINVRKLQMMNSSTARRRTSSIAEIKGDVTLYDL